MTNGTPAPGADLPKPPPVVKRWSRYLLALGVTVAVGLAPFLGKIDVPLFDSLLQMIPDSVQTRLLPLSAFMMGVVAVVVQWHGGNNLSKKWLSRQFGRALGLVIASFLAFSVVSSFTAVQVEYLGGKETASFQVGFTRPLKPPCEDPDLSDEECIKRLTLNRDKIESFWGEKRVRTGGLALVGSYLLLTGSFAWLVGVLVLRDEISERAGKKRKRAGARSPKRGDPPH